MAFKVCDVTKERTVGGMGVERKAGKGWGSGKERYFVPEERYSRSRLVVG